MGTAHRGCIAHHVFSVGDAHPTNHVTQSKTQPVLLRLRRCPDCGYDLANLPRRHICPECGFEYDESMFDAFISSHRLNKSARRLVIIGTMCALPFVCAGAEAVLGLFVASAFYTGALALRIVSNRSIATGRHRLVILHRELRTVADTRIMRSHRLSEFSSVTVGQTLLGTSALRLCGARWSDPGGPRDPFLKCEIDANREQAEMIASVIRSAMERARQLARERAKQVRVPE